eukprot:Sspe_Gene.12654::Locus_4323_Transcript_1_1_Confidence_1.000_Length_2067::g.12654::m.12654
MSNIFLLLPSEAYRGVGDELAKRLGKKLVCGEAEAKKKHPSDAKAQADELAHLEVSNTVVTVPESFAFNQEMMAALKSNGGPVVYLDVHEPSPSESRKRDMEACEAVYDIRLWVWRSGDSNESIAGRVIDSVSQTPWFASTRGKGGPGNGFLHVVRKGLSSDGGLFVPNSIPNFTPADLERLSESTRYTELALRVLEHLIPFAPHTRSVTPQELKNLIVKAYSRRLWDSDEVCPVTDLGGMHMLELHHGPTAAFKDFALQLFPKFFSKAVAGVTDQYVILAATSGDTGVAAIRGFMEEGIPVMVLYPKDGVSAVQKAQMLACEAECHTIRVLGVDADFDLCQTTVKKMFNDQEYCHRLLSSTSCRLSSANSINWGRLMPQIVYYFWGYMRLVHRDTIKVGDLVDIAVPTGNFGNILSAYFAKKMGLPVRRFVCASNVNNVLTDFINTGVYDISQRSLTLTASPSIDILRSSNVERFLYLLSDGKAETVKGLMADLDAKQSFKLPDDMMSRLRHDFTAGYCTEAECLASIRRVQKEYGVLIDTHTAVGYKVATDYLSSVDSKIPLLLASTASYAKFPDAVLEGLEGKSAPTLQMGYDIQETYEAIQKHAPQAKVPRALAEAVSKKLGHTPRTSTASFDEICKQLEDFCNELKENVQ